MSILITIALLLFFNEDSYRDHLSFYFRLSDGGGGALLKCFPDFWVSDVHTPLYRLVQLLGTPSGFFQKAAPQTFRSLGGGGSV